MSKKIWFITGASRGLGRVWAEAALKRGDKVVATARKEAALADLVERYNDAVLALELDVTDSKQVKSVIRRAHEHFGKLDIVVNNAGYALVGAVEEANDEDIRAEFETNFFGALHVIKAVLPILRQQGSGHILGVSSVAGIVAMPLAGFYNASKWAFEAIHESLALEIGECGIKVTLIEPGAYATEFASAMSLKLSEGLDAYANLRSQMFAYAGTVELGDPQATADAVLKIVDAQAPPLRFFLGTEGMPAARAAYASRLAVWEQWEDVSNEAQGQSQKRELEIGASSA